MKNYVAIDVGLKGGIAHVSDMEAGQSRISFLEMPTIKGQEINYKELMNILAFFKGKEVIVGFERLQGIFGTSKKTAWSMAEQVGHIKAFCIALKLPYVAVPPKTWQAEMLQGIKIIKKQKNGETVTDTKAMATIAFQNLFPNIKVPMGPRGKILDGVIDASLIALYLKRKNK